MTYLIRVYNKISKDYPIILELSRKCFTKRDFDQIVETLFELAAESNENRQLVADVFRGECSADVWTKAAARGVGEFAVFCTTHTDGSTINAHVLVNGQPYRVMNIAS